MTDPVPSAGPAQAVALFDLDGTLLDPAGAITEGIADAIEAHGHPRPDEQTLRLFVGPQSEVSLREHTDIPVEEHADIVRTYRAGYPQRARELSHPYPGILDLLQGLRNQGVVMAVATQRPLYIARQVVADFGLQEYFEVLGGARDPQLPEGVPDPEGEDLASTKEGIIGWCLNRLDRAGRVLDPHRTVMVGDRKYDVAGAVAHGIPALGVLWGFGTEAELRDAGAAAVVPDADALSGQIRAHLGLTG